MIYRRILCPGTRDPMVVASFRYLFGLTEREVQIADLVAEGYSALNISKILHISERTVRENCRHIYKKTGLRSNVGLAVYAYKKGNEYVLSEICRLRIERRLEGRKC